MNAILIKEVKPNSGRDTKIFHACDIASTSHARLGVSLSSTADPALIGAAACAVKAFIKLTEHKADPDEIRTRISIMALRRPGTWLAELQPKEAK